MRHHGARVGALATLAIAAGFALGARAANAGDVSIGWDRCAGLAGSSYAKVFACDTDDATFPLVVAMNPWYDMPRFMAVTIVIDVRVEGSSLPDWWRLTGTGCRSSALSVVPYRSSAGDTAACSNAWLGAGVGLGIGFGVTEGYGGSPSGFRLVVDIGQLQPVALSSNHTYLMAVVDLASTGTTGDGSPAAACAGCGVAACLNLAFIDATMSDGSHDFVYPTQGNSWVMFNANAAPYLCYVPTRNSTWGAVKALYH